MAVKQHMLVENQQGMEHGKFLFSVKRFPTRPEIGDLMSVQRELSA